MLLSVALALEYEATCLLAEHRLASGLGASEIRVFLDRLISMAEPVQVHFRWRPQLSDAGDELVLEAAVNGRAQAIVTFNERDLREAKRSFGIEVIRPAEVLRRIER
jgi:predicted nucleic acid-binding protein